MAFKRVADDFDDFNIQRKRRVNDLLLDNIPSDEVTLMANGKLACLVCHHRPVFDTTAVLTLHRNSKKHLANVLVKLERAKEDAEIRQRREHEQYLKSNNCEPESPLLGRTKINKELALNSSQRANLSNRQFGDTKVSSKSFNYKGKTAAGKLFNQQITPETCDNAYGSASARAQGEDNSNNGFFQAKVHFNSQAANSTCNYYSSSSNQTISRQTQDAQFEKDTFFRPNMPLSISVNMEQNNRPSSSSSKYNYLGIKRDSAKQRFLSINPLTQQKIQAKVQLNVPETEQNCDNSKETSKTQHELSEFDRLDQDSKALYLSRVRQLGWVLGLDGKWLKDDNAEFDSDEDEPPSPKTVLKG